jgi:hypothetical protein
MVPPSHTLTTPGCFPPSKIPGLPPNKPRSVRHAAGVGAHLHKRYPVLESQHGYCSRAGIHPQRQASGAPSRHYRPRLHWFDQLSRLNASHAFSLDGRPVHSDASLPWRRSRVGMTGLIAPSRAVARKSGEGSNERTVPPPTPVSTLV